MFVNMKNTTRTQDLREAFASIISMMLGLLRAHGLRGLLYLPEVWLATREIKRIGEAFCEMFAAWGAGLASAPAPQQRQAVPVQSPATPRVRVRSAAPRYRRRPLLRAPTKLAHARPYPTRNPQNRPGPRADILVTARCT